MSLPDLSLEGWLVAAWLVIVTPVLWLHILRPGRRRGGTRRRRPGRP